MFILKLNLNDGSNLRNFVPFQLMGKNYFIELISNSIDAHFAKPAKYRGTESTARRPGATMRVGQPESVDTK